MSNNNTGSMHVLIIDLDNTIVGNVLYQMLAHNLCECLKRNGIKVSNSEKKIGESYKKKNRLIRPYFIDFIKIVRERYPEIMIFVYTASEKKWAEKEIRWIEQHGDIRFDRPIFARDSCLTSNGRYVKSLEKIMPRLKKTTKNKIDLSRTLIIDNNDVFIDHKDCFMRCSDYDYVLFDDLWRFVPKDAMKATIVKQYIEQYIKDGYMNPIPTHVLETVGKMDLKHRYYDWCITNCHKINERNKKHVKDTFWLSMIKRVNDIENKNIVIR